MGYNSDQFWTPDGMDTGEDFKKGKMGTAGGINTFADNPPFRYPSRVIRTVDQDGTIRSKQLSRGYIRSLTAQANLITIPIKKCQFQFNPANLTQSVSQNTSMLNFLQQDPAQYAQPMPGNVNFTFDLFFDRSMELNNLANQKTGLARDEELTNELNPWESSSPGQVGVMKDIASLYAVIGQGMAGYQMEYIAQALEQNIIAEQNAATNAGDDVAEGAAKAISNIPAFLSNNVGNSAFLLPLPVRVVFSSLYIVEGLVSDSTVVFTKFTSNYVPMQAAVSITMEAKYIGFAKKDTFLSYALNERANQEILEAKASSDRTNAVLSAVSNLARSMEIMAKKADGVILTPKPGDSLTPLKELLKFKNQDYYMYSRLPVAEAAKDTSFAIPRLINSGLNPTFKTTAEISVYGPFTPSISINPTQAALERAAKSTVNLSPNIGISPTLLSSTLVPDGTFATATNKEDWNDLASGVRKRFKTTTNWFISTIASVYNPDAAYFIVYYRGKVTVTVDGETITGEGGEYVLVGPGLGDYQLRKTVSLNWPEATPFEETTTISSGGTVPSDNAATNPTPAPNTPSSIGGRPPAGDGRPTGGV